MVDFHTHILPKMDDGSQSVEESVHMLEEIKNQGICAVAATPHFDMQQESIDCFLMRRQQAMEELQAADCSGVTILPGAEVLYCGVPLHSYENLEQLCIGKSRYMLIETLFPQWTKEFQNDLEFLMLERNIIPILAHVERYYTSKNRTIIRELSKAGVVLQMNAEVLLDKKMSRKAWKLLRKETVSLLGSDCHNLTYRPPNLGKAVEQLTNVLGDDVAAWFSKCAETMFKQSL